MSLQIQDGHWYERRDGKIVQASLKYLRSIDVYHAEQLDESGSVVGVVGADSGRANYFPESRNNRDLDRQYDLIREAPPPTKLTLRVGGKYRRRDGVVVAIVDHVPGATWPWISSIVHTYRNSGHVVRDDETYPYDLVSEVLPEPPAKLSLKVGDRCLTRGGKEVVLYATEPCNKNSDTHPLAYSIIPGDQYTVRADGQWSLDGGKDGYDIVSVLPPLDPPAFRITAGEYYTTRDGRCAYVACGPVKLPREAEYDAYFGYVDDPDEDDTIEVVAWYDDGRMEQDNETDFDLVAPWSPPPYVCPHTGKAYNLVEAQ